jgi:hypothetical protein
MSSFRVNEPVLMWHRSIGCGILAVVARKEVGFQQWGSSASVRGQVASPEQRETSMAGAIIGGPIEQPSVSTVTDTVAIVRFPAARVEHRRPRLVNRDGAVLLTTPCRRVVQLPGPPRHRPHHCAPDRIPPTRAGAGGLPGHRRRTRSLAATRWTTTIPAYVPYCLLPNMTAPSAGAKGDCHPSS